MRMLSVVVLAVSCCAPAFAQQPADADPTRACIAALLASETVRPLAGKVSLDGTYPVALLNDRSHANRAQRDALAAAALEIQRCGALGREWRRSKLPAAFAALEEELLLDDIVALADLHAGKLSFGDYNRGRMRAVQDYRRRHAQLGEADRPR